MTKAERDELRELLRIATHGAESPLPWTCDAAESVVIDDEGDAVLTREGLPFDTANPLALTVAAVNALGSLLDAADERDRLREEMARWHPTALAPVAEHPRKDCGACNGSGGVPGEFCGRCEGYGFEPASPPPKFGACLKRRCRAVSGRVDDEYCRACALALERK